MEPAKQVTCRQVVAARALLDMRQDELAKQLGVCSKTISRIELGYRGCITKYNRWIRNALESHGIRFIEGGVMLESDK